MTTQRPNPKNLNIKFASAPWTSQCETYWLLLWLSNPLPAGIYAPLEASAINEQHGPFKGGLGMVQIVRYSDTPVGAYDELLIIPGNFEVLGGKEKGKGKAKAKLRITRIYVGQRDTCYNGRPPPRRFLYVLPPVP